jgi:hypothetical protein
MNALDSCKKELPSWLMKGSDPSRSFIYSRTNGQWEIFLFHFERGRSITSVVFCGTGLCRNKKETGVRGVHVFLCHHQLLVAMLSVPKTDKYTKDENPPPENVMRVWVAKNVLLALSIYSRSILPSCSLSPFSLFLYPIFMCTSHWMTGWCV